MASREWAFRIVAPVAGVLTVCLAVEVGLRVFGVDPLGDLTGPRTLILRESAHPDLEYELTPGAAGSWGKRSIEINRHGFRDREYSLEKAPDIRRILVVGDSITFGYGLRPEQRFPEQLEARFRDAGAKVEVLNLGVGGYDTLDEVAFLEQVGLDFGPDLVVVGFCINDLGVQSVNLRTIRVLRRYGGLIRRSRLLQLLTVRVDRSGLRDEIRSLNAEDEFRRRNAERIVSLADDPELLDRMASLRREIAEARHSSPAPYLSWYTSEAKVGKLRFSFARLARLADEHGFEVLVAIFPFLDERRQSDAYRLAYDLVHHEAARAGFEVLELRDVFEAFGFEKLMLHGKRPTPLHPNEEGHRIAAQHLFETLRDRWQ